MTTVATPIFATGHRSGSACVPLADVAAELSIHPAKLYAAALAAKVSFQRIGVRLHAERWALEAAAATCYEPPT